MTSNFFQKISSIPKHSILLLGIVLFIFVFPLLSYSIASRVLITISYSIMLLSVGAVIEQKTKWLYYGIVISVIMQWIDFLLPNDQFNIIHISALLFSVITFIITSYILIQQIVVSKKVNAQLILESIIGYLLVGVIFTLINVVILTINPEAIGFTNQNYNIDEIIYYSFVTVTTIGYGDISPISEIARSAAVLFGLIGQLYLTIIIAFIIGKYLNAKN